VSRTSPSHRERLARPGLRRARSARYSGHPRAVGLARALLSNGI
jgi:hypothetical protein